VFLYLTQTTEHDRENTTKIRQPYTRYAMYDDDDDDDDPVECIYVRFSRMLMIGL